MTIKIVDRIFILSISLLFLICFSASIHAATYYVSTTGSDSNPGTITSPWLTVRHATSTVSAGDTVYLRGGTYTDHSVTFSNSGSSGSPITIIAYPGEVPVLDAGFTTASQSSAPMGFFEIDGPSYITLDGLEIMRGSRTNIHLGYNNLTNYITIQNCHLHDLNVYDNSGMVMLENNASNITIQNNKMHHILTSTGSGTSGEGVWIGLGPGNYIIQNNELYDLIQGIWPKYKQSDNSAPLIQNNLIHDVTTYGIQVANNNSVILNNIIYNTGNGYAAIRVTQESSACSTVGGLNTSIIHNTIDKGGDGAIVLYGPSACTGTLNTIVKNNLIYNSDTGNYPSLTIWPYQTSGSPNTTEDYNLYYSSSYSRADRQFGTVYTLSQWTSQSGQGLHSLWAIPIFTDYVNHNYNLASTSPGRNAASDGTNIGANFCQVGINKASCPAAPSAPLALSVN